MMIDFKIKLLGLLAATMLLTACVIDPYTGEETVSNTTIGAVSGAVLGAAVAGSDDRAKGAVIGAALGGGIGYYMDVQEAKLRKQLEGTGVRVQREGDNIRLIMPGNITFATGSSNINSNFYAVLNSVALVFEEFDETQVSIVGYTDSVGSTDYNQSLSETRANSVSAYLVNQGVERNRVAPRGMGERNPIASNESDAGRAQNRRVEITITPNG